MKISVKSNLKLDKLHQKNKSSPSKKSILKRTNDLTVINWAKKIKSQGLLNLIRILQSVIFMFFMLASLDVRIKGLGVLAKPTNPPEQKYEEYYVEHEISSTQAKNSVIAYSSKSMSPPPGCQRCTTEELLYCGSSLMNDHCCCDKQYFEKLPFIPHTCYLGTQPCTPITDCAMYARLRDCCCNNLLIKKWKEINSAKSLEAIFSMQILFVFIHILRLEL